MVDTNTTFKNTSENKLNPGTLQTECQLRYFFLIVILPDRRRPLQTLPSPTPGTFWTCAASLAAPPAISTADTGENTSTVRTLRTVFQLRSSSHIERIPWICLWSQLERYRNWLSFWEISKILIDFLMTQKVGTCETNGNSLSNFNVKVMKVFFLDVTAVKNDLRINFRPLT